MPPFDTSAAPPASGRRATGGVVTAAPVVALGLITEAVLLAGLAWPLRIWQPPDAITDPEPLSQMVGRSGDGLALFLLTLAVWCAAYLGALALGRRAPTRGARLALLGFPALFALTLAPTWPAASKDVYHYIMEGRTLALYGENPLTTAPGEIARDPLFWILSSWQWEPSRYGPLWALVAAVPAAVAGDSLTGLVLGFKAIGVAAFLATGWLTYLAARRLRPGSELAAYVLVAWNPLFLFEAAANGHNDVLMVAFTALALYLAARRDWTLAFPALAAAVLVKYITGLIGPVLVVWAWRGARGRAGERRSIVVGLALAAWLVVSSYAVFWTGPETLRAVSGAAGEALNSPGWLAREALERTVASPGAARLIVGVPLALLFLGCYALALRGAWRGSSRTDAPLLGSLGALAAYLATVSWWFWPWYVTWLLPAAALLAGTRVTPVVVVWSIGALAAYVPIAYRPYLWGEPSDDRMPFWVTLCVFLPAAMTAFALMVRSRRRPSGEAIGTPAADRGSALAGP